jgi:DNA-binding GntR family transcriptional regulator
MPVRDAVNRLVTQGALEMLPTRSVRVPIMTRARFDELTEVRCFLEGTVTERAAPLVDASTLEAMLSFDARMVQAAANNDIDGYLRDNFSFHLMLYRCSRSEVMLTVIEGLWLQAGPFLTAYLRQAGFKKANAHHGRIITAVKRGNGSAARKSIVADIQEAAESARSVLA